MTKRLSKRKIREQSERFDQQWEATLAQIEAEGGYRHHHIRGGFPCVPGNGIPMGLETCTHFKRRYDYQPATVIQWRWSVDWGRWQAHVRFEDGYEMVTSPAPRADGNEIGALFCRINRDAVVIP